MAHVRKGQLTPPPQWWRHLRDWKRVFWKRERKEAKREAIAESKTRHPRRVFDFWSSISQSWPRLSRRSTPSIK